MEKSSPLAPRTAAQAAQDADLSSFFAVEMERLRPRLNIPGMSVEMYINGRHYRAHVGSLAAGETERVTQSSRFATACLIKLLVSIEILKLTEQGRMDLDASVAEYLPELGSGGKTKGRIVKIRHLLSHTGGYRGFLLKPLLVRAHESWSNCVEMFQEAEQLFEPGTVFNEENLDHIILGQVVSRLKGRPVLDVIRDEVLAPMKVFPADRMRDVDSPAIYAHSHDFQQDRKTWEKTEDTYQPPDVTSGTASSMSMTSGDLFRIGKALLDGDSPGQLSRFVRDNLFGEAIKLPNRLSPLHRKRWLIDGFGLGLATFGGGHTGYFTTGRGQNSCIAFDRNRRFVVALSINAPDGNAREVVLNTLFAKFANDETITPEAGPTAVKFDEFVAGFSPQDLAGTYVGFMPNPITIVSDSRGFGIHIDGAERYILTQDRNGLVVLQAKMPVPIALFADPASRVPCLMVGLQAFKKTKLH